MSEFTTERRLCDDDGMVSQARVPDEEFLTYRGLADRLRAHTGLEPVTEDFHCTGSAHLAGEHIRCTSPAHVPPPTGRPGVISATGGYLDSAGAITSASPIARTSTPPA